MTSINQFERMIYSQNGEDGILSALAKRLWADGDGYFVEFGVEDGSQCNTRHLTETAGWRGLLIEGNPDGAEQAGKRYADYPVTVVESFITKDNIVHLLDEAYVPLQPQLLSVDIDGNDYWVLKAILDGGYRPDVLVCEYNGAIPPDEKWVMEYNADHQWDGTTYYGTGLRSLTRMTDRFGYVLIGTDSVGVNAFFVRHDLLGRLEFPGLTPEQAYHAPQFHGHRNNGKKGHLPGYGPHLEI